MTLVFTIGIATGCVYAIVAAGYSLIYRTTSVVNFAQGSYVMMGGLITSWLFSTLKVPYAVAILGGIVAASLTGAVLWFVVVLPSWRRRSPAYVILLETIIFGVIVSTAMLLALGPSPQTLPDWFPRLALEFGESHIDGQYLIVAAITLTILAGFACVLRFTTLGRAMRACAASRETSALLGISPERVGAIAFIVTASLGGVAGAIIAPAQFTSPDSGLAYGMFGFVAAVIGGFGSLQGALAGGLLLGLINAFVGRYVSSNYETVISLGVLLVLLACRPQGLFGTHWEES